MPIVVPLIVVLLVAPDLRADAAPRYGRHLYAVGGNREAARRAGISVDRIRISRLRDLLHDGGGRRHRGRLAGPAPSTPNTGGSNVLLYAVGAAVIGGTSLFGGKGRVLDAVLGGAVVAVIDNGMGLLGRQLRREVPVHRAWCCCSRPASTRSPGAGPRDREPR